MQTNPKRFAVLLGWLLTSLLLQVKGQTSDYGLYLNTGKHLNQSNYKTWVQAYPAGIIPADSPELYRIVQFNEIPGHKSRTELASAGIILHDYLPEYAFYATLKPGANVAALGNYAVRGIYDILPHYKLSHGLFTLEVPQHAQRGNERFAVYIHLMPGLVAQKWQEAFDQMGIQAVPTEISEDYIEAELTWQQLNQVIGQTWTRYVEAVNPPAVPDNSTAGTLHRSNALLSAYQTGPYFDGSGIQVMLQDDGIVGPHIDYQGRIPYQNISFNNGDHGDHIAGTIMGAGNLNPLGRGMAPGADLHVYTASNYQGFNLIGSHYTTREIRITSTSYSDGCNAGYTSLTRTMDQQSRNHRKLIHVFSAGNTGTDDCGYGAGPGWGNITGGHKAAKNVIAVGNVTYTDGLASSSSRGPAHDGRIKPEVVAKGTNVYSTTNPNLYTQKTGTSMACPGVSGTLAQLYQAYREMNNQTYPDGGLMKAILMNTAEDLGNPGPDFKFGYGRIDAGRALKMLQENRYDSSQIDQGQFKQHMIAVPEGTAQVRFMIYWTDYEATIGTTKALVNDLNMEVTAPDASVYQPWVLNHLPPAANLNAPAERGIDSRNNVEQVTIDNPLAGNYVINVQGILVPQGPQRYYLTWEFIPENIEITYPAGGESFVPAEKETLRWNAPETSETFSLHYSIDGGTSWSEIASGVPANMRHFDWTIPNAMTASAHIRVVNGEKETLNAVPFHIMGQPQNLSISWACNDAFRIVWEGVYGAEWYIVRKLGEKYMDSVATTPNTSYIFSNTGQNETWVSVQAIGADGATSRRTIALKKEAGTFNCTDTDLAAEDIPSTEWRVYNDCHDLGAIPVSIAFRNIAANPTGGFTAGYALNGGTPVTESIQGTLSPDSAMIHLFAEPINLTLPGTYTLKAWVTHNLDGNPANDTVVRQIRVISGNLVQSPIYQQNFDAFTRCLTHPICELYECNLAEGWTNYSNNAEDQIDWRTFGGITPTSGTGPSVDHTTGTAQGNYLYIEPSVFCMNREAIVLTPCFDFTNHPDAVVRFWYHMWGEHTGRLHLDALVNGNIIYDIIPPLMGNQSNEWREASVTGLPQALVSFRFRGVTGPGQNSDIAIDDFEVDMGVGITKTEIPAFALEVFPNPSDGSYNLVVKHPGSLNLKLTVSDMTGRIMYANQIRTDAYSSAHPLELGHLTAGIYILAVEGNQTKKHIRIIRK